jgi:hypothetical protein
VAGQQFVNNLFSFAATPGQTRGAEISGGRHYGGYWYSFAVVDQNTTGVTAVSDFVPSATGANSGGVGFQSDANFKDLYAHFMYRFNLEKDKESRHAIQAAGPTGPRDHTYLELGTYYFYGRAVERVTGVLSDLVTPTLLSGREPFYRVGGHFGFNYRALNLFGLYMYGHDNNLVPVTGSTGLPVGFTSGTPATFSGGFLQADYLLYPWMMLIMRYDAVNSPSDFLNGQTLSLLGQPFFAPAHMTRNRYTPGVQFLIHANIKASFEYQVRPQQQITTGVDPLTGASVTIRPFRVNTAVAGLEFVY